MDKSAQKIFLISPVGKISPAKKHLTELFVAEREHAGHTVHWPQRDVEGNYFSFPVLSLEREKMKVADSVWIVYSTESNELCFLLAMAIFFKKDLYLVNPDEVEAAAKTDYLANLIRELISQEKIRNVQPREGSLEWLTLNQKLSPIKRMLMHTSLTPVFTWRFREEPEDIFCFGGFFANLNEHPKQLKLQKGNFTNLALEIIELTKSEDK